MTPAVRICLPCANPPIEAQILHIQGKTMDAVYMIAAFIVVMLVLNIASTGRID